MRFTDAKPTVTFNEVERECIIKFLKETRDFEKNPTHHDAVKYIAENDTFEVSSVLSGTPLEKMDFFGFLPMSDKQTVWIPVPKTETTSGRIGFGIPEINEYFQKHGIRNGKKYNIT